MDNMKEKVIYINQPFKKYRWISYYSLIYVSLVALNMVILPFPQILKEHLDSSKSKFRKKNDENGTFDIESSYELNPDYKEVSLTERIAKFDYKDVLTGKYLAMNFKQNPALVIFALGGGVLIPSLFSLYLRRIVHKITLTSNNRVKFEFFSPIAFGKPPRLEVPIQSVSCRIGRTTTQRNSILKLRGYWGYHLVNLQDGVFNYPELYDSHLGYERSWAART